MTSSANGRYLTLGSWHFKVWQLIAFGLIFFIVMFTVVWWFNNFERVSNTSYQLTERANYNPYYAAELLIQQTYSDKSNDEADNEDVKPYVQTLLDDDIKTLVGRLDELPIIAANANYDDNNVKTTNQPTLRPVLIINSMTTKLSQERFMALQYWVEQGGHLITFTGNGVDEEAFNEVLALTPPDKAANLSDSNNEAQGNNRLTELNVGNQFLAQLGIVAVQQTGCEDNCSEADKQSADVDKALAQLEEQYGITIEPETEKLQSVSETADAATSESKASQSTSPQNKLKDETTAFKEAVERLTANQNLAMVNPPNYSARLTHTVSSLSEPLLLKNIDPDVVINYELFQQRYPQSVSSPLASTQVLNAEPEQQANSIRQYLQRELAHFEASQPAPTTTANSDKSKTSKKASQLANKEISQMVRFLLTLEDDTLIALFAPEPSVYLDVPFGEGRISVLKDRTIFSNPNPNIDLEDAATKVSQWTPLLELLDNDYYQDFTQNLYDADNAKLLVALTEQASEVWILPNTDVEPLPVLLWRQAMIAVLGLGLLLLIWLWSLYDRFGKHKVLPQTQANNILRYFYQVGRYGWDFDRANTLVSLSRQQTRAALYDYLAKITTANAGLAAVRDVLQQAAAHHQPQIMQPTDNTEVTPAKMGNHTQKANNAGNYNNPLALLNAKQLTCLSEALMTQYQQKNRLNKQLDANAEAGRLARTLDTNLDSDSSLDLEIGVLGGAGQVLSSERISEALIQPLSLSHSAQTLSDITQTLWLLNWVLR